MNDFEPHAHYNELLEYLEGEPDRFVRARAASRSKVLKPKLGRLEPIRE